MKHQCRALEKIAAVMNEQPRLPDEILLSEIQDFMTIAGYDVPVRSYRPEWTVKDGKWVLGDTEEGK